MRRIIFPSKFLMLRKKPALCYAVTMKTLDEKRITALLALPEVQVEARETLPSTNDACRALLASGVSECLVLAERQTGGRGRRASSR